MQLRTYYLLFCINISLLTVLFQIRGMHTIIRDAATATHDFIFYADRLIRLVSIYAYSMSCLLNGFAW
jgi:uracil phosphoribosyltransferase